MVPPPDNTGDVFPDFDKMTPEEQMAWLESLARRQGAKAEEFTTAANLEIPIPENPVIDEPGYVPYSISEKPAARPSEPSPPPAEVPEFQEEPVSALEEEPEMAVTMDEMGDPMQWLNTLAIQPDAELAELERDALEWNLDLEESESPDLDFLSELEPEMFEQEETPDFQAQEEPSPAVFPEPVQASSAPPIPDLDDPLGGLDPMLWLESLAARQGASRDQLTTSADLDIDEVPEGTVIDEPGYVPYDIVAGGPRPESSFRAREPEPEEPKIAPPEPEVPVFEPPGIPEPEYLQIPEEETFEESEPEMADEGLSWLESLAAEPDEDVSELLALGGDLLGNLEFLAEEPLELPEFESEPESVVEPDAGDPLSGMSDEQIAYAQAHGQLTGEQELAWLKRQAAKLAEVRESEEAPEEFVGFDEAFEISPAEPGMLPDWLRQMREESEQDETAPEKPSVLLSDADLASEAIDFSEWLEEPVAETEPDLSELQLGTEADVEKLWAEAVESIAEPEEEAEPESELVAFLEGTLVPEEPDQLAEALDAEYERRVAGDDSEPEWYAEAVVKSSQLESEDLSVEGIGKIIEPAEPEESTEEVLAQAMPMEDMPDWLREVQPEALAAAEEPVPDWLVQTDQELPEMAGLEDIPDWLTEDIEAAVPSDAGLDWLTEAVEGGLEPEPALSREEHAPPEPDVPIFVPDTAASEPAPEAQPMAVEPLLTTPEPEIAVTRKTSAPIPEGELFEQYARRLSQDPNDFATRLALARALRVNRQIASSLNHYEVLIDNAQLLQDVSTDLSILVEEQPGVPRMRRLLGDAYMRQGKLREALDAYRSALDQL